LCVMAGGAPVHFPSFVEAPEEPTIHANVVGIPVDSKELGEVRYTRVARW
jgi:hypothetical protein